jgi:hypothetical protein
VRRECMGDTKRGETWSAVAVTRVALEMGEPSLTRTHPDTSDPLEAASRGREAAAVTRDMTCTQSLWMALARPDGEGGGGVAAVMRTRGGT